MLSAVAYISIYSHRDFGTHSMITQHHWSSIVSLSIFQPLRPHRLDVPSRIYLRRCPNRCSPSHQQLPWHFPANEFHDAEYWRPHRTMSRLSAIFHRRTRGNVLWMDPSAVHGESRSAFTKPRLRAYNKRWKLSKIKRKKNLVFPNFIVVEQDPSVYRGSKIWKRSLWALID